MGHAPRLRDPLGFLTRTGLVRHEGLARLRVGPFSALLVCDPDLTHRMLVEDRTFDKGGPHYDRAREWLGNGLVSCPHGVHRRQRRAVQPAFHADRMPAYARAMAEQISSITDRWHEGQVLDVLPQLKAITARAAIATMFADMPRNVSVPALIHEFDLLVAGVYRRMWMPAPLDRLPVLGNGRYYQARDRVRRTIGRIIDTYRTRGTDNGDLLSLLLASGSAEGGRAVPDEEVIDQVMTFFVGGTEPPAVALSWALHLLTQHPKVEERLHAEVDSVLTDAGTGASFADLPRLRFTEQVITEALRLYPPLWMVTRTTTTDTELGGHHVKQGTVLVYSPYLIHHRPGLYPDPELFDPDRWGDDSPTKPRKEAFIPFGAGARKCIGDTFGIAEATLALATIARSWRLEPVPGRNVRPSALSVLSPGGLTLKVRSRKLR